MSFKSQSPGDLSSRDEIRVGVHLLVGEEGRVAGAGHGVLEAVVEDRVVLA